jgi:ABC-type multidrug transport system ATPase subunit
LPQGFSALERLSVGEIITLFADMYEESRSHGELMVLLSGSRTSLVGSGSVWA